MGAKRDAVAPKPAPPVKPLDRAIAAAYREAGHKGSVKTDAKKGKGRK